VSGGFDGAERHGGLEAAQPVPAFQAAFDGAADVAGDASAELGDRLRAAVHPEIAILRARGRGVRGIARTLGFNGKGVGQLAQAVYRRVDDFLLTGTSTSTRCPLRQGGSTAYGVTLPT
jgi:hypothetical protein